ncbi:hypothetical protein CVT24_012241 [Panaeolus cyanescens]|uniref:Uncharacterized protein n=1 Tax=Panaeolus cyanescens TaxID=181874 RepID=A0A409WRX0_9AGAR|nr:hypothetical protein CVT24_012241 [Panaeolus cyanescens]
MSSLSSPSSNPRKRFRLVPEHSPFTELLAEQASANDLVVYSVAARQGVRIAWPTYNGGTKVKPSGFKDFCAARGAHIECFCKALHIDQPMYSPARIVTSGTGRFMLYCTDEPTTCGFELDLCHIYHHTTLTSDYRHLQPCLNNGFGTLSKDAKDLVALRISQLDNVAVAPYLEGFLGDVVPGVKQLTSTHWRPQLSGRSFVTAPGGPKATTSTPSSSQSMSQIPGWGSREAHVPDLMRMYNSQDARLKAQQDLLEDAVEGCGIPTKVWEDLFEHCRLCDTTFLQGHFKAHSRMCWEAVTQDNVESSDE